jgi:hypothetical protein
MTSTTQPDQSLVEYLLSTTTIYNTIIAIGFDENIMSDSGKNYAKTITLKDYSLLPSDQAKKEILGSCFRWWISSDVFDTFFLSDCVQEIQRTAEPIKYWPHLLRHCICLAIAMFLTPCLLMVAFSPMIHELLGVLPLLKAIIQDWTFFVNLFLLLGQVTCIVCMGLGWTMLITAFYVRRTTSGILLLSLGCAAACLSIFTVVCSFVSNLVWVFYLDGARLHQ